MQTDRHTSESFLSIVTLYQKSMYYAAYRISGNREDALDIVQESFMKLHVALCEGTLSCDPGAWLYRVTVNAAIDHIRRIGRYQHVEYDDTNKHITGIDTRPDIEAERHEAVEIIHTLTAELSEKQAEVFMLRDIEGKSVPEIGIIIGCTENTVRVHLSRARLALRDMLKKRYPHLIETGSDLT